MLCVVVTKNEDIEKAAMLGDLVELRADCMAVSIVPPNSIVTVRKKSHGGFFVGSEEERFQLLESLAKLGPEFIDIEYDTDPRFFAHIAKTFPKVKIISSLHNFEQTPDDLDAELDKMQSPYVHAYKLATFANSSLDALRMLQFIRQAKSHVIGIAMGEKGSFARIAGKIFGNYIDYACLDNAQKTAPGQLTADELIDIYRYKALKKTTKLYALIGDPITKSIGHLVHNQVMKALDIDALYLKIQVTPDKLHGFLDQAKRLFSGLSVTMPLKEAIIPYLDELHTDMGAVNTIRIENEKLLGFNTDGQGALDAIEKRAAVRDKTVLIVGAGGAAKAIAMEAKARGAKLIILNRSIEKAEALANHVSGLGGTLDELLDINYDMLINCTPEPLTITPKEHVIVMDIDITIRPNCTIQGYEMFINQAALQWHHWADCHAETLPIISLVTERIFK